jgi:predicted AlkP superfamily phosphohydrolase/phosphomutase
LYLNVKGRESQGIVEPGAQATALKREIAAKLSGLRDEERDRVAIRKAWASDALYKGPYLDAAPDVIVGYADGYRASWDAAVGKVAQGPFSDNRKAWSGDHCIDPHLVPGVLFCNRAVALENPGIEDMAPTALDLFGIEPPPYMEGKALFRQREKERVEEVAA